MTDFLKITQPAKEKINALITDCGEEGLAFRAKVIGGGCQGMQYVFELHEPSESDRQMEVNIDENKFSVIVDPISGQYLDGITIDYQESLSGQQFVIHNPNAMMTCSCGSSFSDEN